MHVLPQHAYFPLLAALALGCSASFVSAAEDALVTSDMPPAVHVASTLLPAEELPDRHHPGAFVVAWGGEAYRRVGDRYWAEDGTCWKAIRVTTTAYVPVREQCNDDPEHTATMTKAKLTYGIAADPRALPYGTVLRVPGYGQFRVDDTGGAMRQSWQRGVVHLDLRIPFQRYDGVWRDAATCNRIAFRHGRQEDRIILVQVPEPVYASVERSAGSVVSD